MMTAAARESARNGTGTALRSLAAVVAAAVLLDSFSQLIPAVAQLPLHDPAARHAALRLILSQATPWLLASALAALALSLPKGVHEGGKGRPAAAAVYLLLAGVALALTAAFVVASMERGAALTAGELFAHRKAGWQGVISGLCLVTGLAGFGLVLRRGTANRT